MENVKKWIASILFSVSLILMGCKPSLNMKKASVDAGAGIAVVSYLQNVDEDKFESKKEEIIKFCIDVKDFINTGNLSELPLSIVKKELIKFTINKGYGEYTFILDSAFAYINTKNIDVDFIGVNNVNLIIIALEECIKNAERCTVEGR